MHVITVARPKEYGDSPAGRETKGELLDADRVEPNRQDVPVRFSTDAASGTLFVRFIGTHDEYDRVDVRTV